MIKTLIVDDEPLARKRLRKLLEAFQDIEVIDEAENGCVAVQKIEALTPDMLLLDVQMPDLDGFDVLRMVDSARNPLVVFTTAFDDYAINAFEVNAIDYLLKPVKRDRLERAVGRVRDKIAAAASNGPKLSALLESHAQKSKDHLRRLPVRTGNRILIVSVDEITSFRIDRGLVFVTCAEGEFWTKYTTFGQLEGQLDPDVFMRVHRQSIVNLNKIREVRAFDNSTARLVLHCGREVIVSRAQMRQLREVLGL